MRLDYVCFAFLAALTPAFAADDYQPGPDSMPHPDVPAGTVSRHTFDKSNIYPGTTRDYWVYVPKQYDATKPSPVMIFQDGLLYQATNVCNNLIHKKEIPPLVGIFVTPGRVPALSTNALDRYNRSVEYDGLGDNYARFLLDELLPHIATNLNLNLSTNGNDRAIAGSSSGGICAFTAAWERPDAFRRVFSSVGTFVGLRGGNEYPTLIRKTEPKPIRVFLQDGTNDLNIYGGNWFLANREMLSALEFSGYDVNHVWGDGGHNGKQATAIFPDALRWLWRDYPKPIIANTEGKSRQPLMDILEPGQDWQVASQGHRFTEGPAVSPKGELYFSDLLQRRIYKMDRNGRISVFKEESGGANGMMFGPDGRLYVCQNRDKKIVAYDENGKEEVIADQVPSNDLTTSYIGNIYFTDPLNGKVWLIDAKREKSVVDEGIAEANGIRLSPDQSLLYVSDTRGRFVYSFQIQPDGKLADKQRFYRMQMEDLSIRSAADGMTVDADGRLYVATELGLQVCDQAGRVIGIIPKPQDKWLSNAVFAGPAFNLLCVTCGDKVYVRRTKVKGALSWQPPFKPAPPRL